VIKMSDKPRVQPGVWQSGWNSLLLFDVLAHDVDGHTATGCREVARRPQHAPTLEPRMEVSKLLAKHPAGDALEAVHERGERDLGRVVDEQVNMIGLAIELDELCVEIVTDGTKDRLERRHVLLTEDTAPVFGHEDQMCMDGKNAVSSSAKVLFLVHRPIMLQAVKALKTLQIRVKDQARSRAAPDGARGHHDVEFPAAKRA